MKVIPTLGALAVARTAASFSFVLCLILLEFLAGQGLAQTSIPGYTPSAPRLKQNLSLEEKARRGAAPLSRIRPGINIELARAHRLRPLTSSEARPERKSMRLRVGAVRQIDRPLAAQTDATFFQTPEGKLYVMRVASEGAAMTRLHFSRVALPEGARLFVFSRANPDDYHALHIQGEDGLDVTGKSAFWTPPLTGEEVVVEYLTPTAAQDAPMVPQPLPFVIDQVSHIFLDPRAARSAGGVQQDGPGLCNVNVPAEWGEAAKSVGMLQFTTPKGEFACSGVLLNNARNDGTPYVLTANHCLSRMAYTGTVTMYWLYDNGDSPTNGTPRSLGGGVIATGASGDFTLLQFPSVPTGVRFAGWTTEMPAAPTPVTSIHHPQASYKRFSSGNTAPGACPSGLPRECSQYLPVRWQNGVTEPGSSGAPLWTGSPSDPRVVGLLSGGSSSCNNQSGIDFYSRFDLAFSAIAPYLTGQGCAFALEPVKPLFGSRDAQTQEIFSSAGGDGSVNLKIRSGTDCPWSARSEAPWITLTSTPDGSGEATIMYSVAPHTESTPRFGYLLIAGHRLLITQMGVSNCATAASGIGQSFGGALSGNDCRSALDTQAYADRYTFSAQAGQQIILTMSSSTIDTFLLLFGPDGKLIEYNDDYSFTTGSVIPGVSGHVELAASGDYTIEATSFEPGETGPYQLEIKRVCSLRFTQEPALIPAAGGNGQVKVTAPPACQWSAQTQVNWLTINSGSGDGNGAITFTAAANPAIAIDNGVFPREAPIIVVTSGASFTSTVKQNYNCGFRVTPNNLIIKPFDIVYGAPINQAIGVGTGNGCQWTATSNVPWMEFYGYGPNHQAVGGQYLGLSFNSIKLGDTPRVGTLTIAGQSVTVTQEPTGTICPPGELSIGQTLMDSLSPNCRSITSGVGYVKQYKFRGRAGQRVAITLSSGEVFPRVWVRRMLSDDELSLTFFSDRDGADLISGKTLRIPATGFMTLPADGTYLIDIARSSYAPDKPGTFVISLSEAGAAPCDLTLSAYRNNLLASGGRGSIGVNAECEWTAITTAPWIKISAGGAGAGAGQIEYVVEPNAGAYRSGAIAVAGQHLIITQQSANAPAVVSAASYAPSLATGAIHAMFGVGLATQTVAASTLPLPTTLGDAQVIVTTAEGGVYEAPLFFVSPNQINFLMPPGVFPGVVNFTVKVNGQTTGETRAALGILAPALFTYDGSGRGVPAAYVLRARRDGTQTTEQIYDRDAAGAIIPREIRLADDENVFLILYGTGFSGAPGIGAEIEATFQPDLTQKGLMFSAPGFAGLEQINLPLPLSLRGRGDVTLTIKRNGFASNPVTIRIGQ